MEKLKGSKIARIGSLLGALCATGCAAELHEQPVEEEAAGDEAAPEVAVQTSALGWNGCSTQRKNQLEAARQGAKSALQTAGYYYLSFPESDHAWASFGDYDQNRYYVIANMMLSSISKLQDGSYWYNCVDSCVTTGFAEFHAPNEVRLCAGFWGDINRAEVLAHEMTHFFGTTDTCQDSSAWWECAWDLAANDPWAAVANAYNYQLFVGWANGWI